MNNGKMFYKNCLRTRFINNFLLDSNYFLHDYKNIIRYTALEINKGETRKHIKIYFTDYYWLLFFFFFKPPTLLCVGKKKVVELKSQSYNIRFKNYFIIYYLRHLYNLMHRTLRVRSKNLLNFLKDKKRFNLKFLVNKKVDCLIFNTFLILNYFKVYKFNISITSNIKNSIISILSLKLYRVPVKFYIPSKVKKTLHIR